MFLPVSWASRIRSTIKQEITPVLNPLYQSSLGLRKIAMLTHDLKNLPKENEDLSREVSSLLSENARLKEVDHENALLKKELQISSPDQNRKLVEAKIVARSSLSFLDIVTIDKGSSEGIKTNQAVTLNGSLIGKITSTASRSSDVELVTSGNAITQAQLQGSRATGIIRGGIRGLVLEYIPQDVQVVPGEMVITSGLGGEMRSGILIGTIMETISKKNDVYQSFSVKPATNISRVDLLFVEVVK